MKKINLKSILISSLMLVSFSMNGQQIPIDPKVRFGKLDNGLTYYIRANQQPKQRAEFYIAQNVGSILENDDQNGLAHFLEHMAFNGTKNFPGKGIINFLEKHGVKFGENINAYTALDETVYNLSDVPVTNEGVVDSALLVLHDWSGYLLLEGKEIDDERGVILEEWRTRFGAERRMWKESNKIKYDGSQYAKRDGIGDTAIIKHFKYQTIRDYYQKWYRPDQQAILVVGDIDVDKMEAKIKALFSSIPKKPNAGERPVYEIQNNTEPIIALVKDAEARLTRIEIDYKHDKLPAEVKLSINGYMVGVVNNLISTMLGYRFDEITQKADAPFVGGSAAYGELVKSKDAFELSVIPGEGREEEGLKAALLESEKMKRFGFTNSELERAKTDYLKMIEKVYNDRDNQKNNSLVEEYVRNFLHNEVIPGIEWEYKNLQMMLPQLTLDIVNKVAKSYITEDNVMITIMSPDKPSVMVPDLQRIKALITEVKNAELTAKKEENLNKPLIEKAPKPGKIKKSAQNQSLGSTEWTLSNGVKIVIKPTKFKEDEILLSAFSWGGLSKVKNTNDLTSATLATSVVSNNGLGNFPLIELNKVLTGKIATVQPGISAYDESFDGNSSVTDFETLLQLIYLNFTAPRKDDDSFKALMNMYKASLANSASDPRKAFSDSINLMVSNHSSRTVLLNLNSIDKVDQDKALTIFKERFANPADFTFIFTGNIDPANEKVKTAILTYLGGIKAKKEFEKYTDNNIRKPRGEVKNYFAKEMKTRKASNLVLYSGAMPYNITNRTVMTAIGDILTMRYTENIREKEGGTYGVGVRGSLTYTPIEEATLVMQFDTDPEKQTKLIGIIHSEIQEILKNGPKEEDLQKVKENMLKQYSEDLAENNWWDSALIRYYRDHLNMVTDYKPSVEALTPELIKSTLKKLVDQDNILEVVMKPAQ